MPYIDQHRREALAAPIFKLQYELERLGFEEGDLNYVISRLVGFYFQQRRRYFTIARIRGVLANVAEEFYRRMAAPYEDAAIRKNGDIPEYENREE